jgi:hypothetical protein
MDYVRWRQFWRNVRWWRVWIDDTDDDAFGDPVADTAGKPECRSDQEARN